jgi:hypothetical protein
MTFYFNYFSLFLLGILIRTTSLSYGSQKFRDSSFSTEALERLSVIAQQLRFFALFIVGVMIVGLLIEWREKKRSKKVIGLSFILPLILLFYCGGFFN